MRMRRVPTPGAELGSTRINVLWVEKKCLFTQAMFL